MRRPKNIHFGSLITLPPQVPLDTHRVQRPLCRPAARGRLRFQGQGLRFRVQGAGFRVQSAGFRV